MLNKLRIKLIRHLDKGEPYLYFFILVYFTIQPFWSGYFTYDGPAHLYNSNLIIQLLNNNSVENYISFNSVLVPNWSGHFLLSLFQFFLDPIKSELLLLSLIIFFSNYFFRRLITVLNGELWASWLFFPFSMSFLFFMGFYNLVIAIALMFYFLKYLITQQRRKEKSIKHFLFLSILFLLIYFSHLFIFLFTGLLGGIVVLYFLSSKDLLKGLLFLLLTAIIPLVLTVKFLMLQPKGVYVFLPKEELFLELIRGRILTVFGDPELMISTSLVVVLVLLVCLSVFNYRKLAVKLLIFVGSVFGICLFMYAVLPNTNGYVGFISLRSGLLLFITIIIFISISFKGNKYLKYVLIFGSIIMTLISIKRVRQFKVNFTQMKSNYEEVLYVAKNIIPSHSVIKLKNKPAHWFYPHLDNYFGVFKDNILILDSNYELDQKYFPLVRNSKTSSEIKQVIEIEFNPKNKGDNYIYQSSFILVK